MDVEITRKTWEMQEIGVAAVRPCCDGWRREFGREITVVAADSEIWFTPRGLVSPVTGREVRTPVVACPFCGTAVKLTVNEEKAVSR